MSCCITACLPVADNGKIYLQKFFDNLRRFSHLLAGKILRPCRSGRRRLDRHFKRQSALDRHIELLFIANLRSTCSERVLATALRTVCNFLVEPLRCTKADCRGLALRGGRRKVRRSDSILCLATPAKKGDSREMPPTRRDVQSISGMPHRDAP